MFSSYRNCAHASVRPGRMVGKYERSHFPSCRLDLDLIWQDELRLEFPAPFNCTLDALARFI